jgi:hypothetical protein
LTVAATEIALTHIPLAAIFPLPVELGETDALWPAPGAPEPNLYATGMTEARCVVEYFYATTADDRVDALKHLANICGMKVSSAYWSPSPYLRFVDARTSKKDWENCNPRLEFLRKIATRGWFLTQIPQAIEKYSPRYITRRELLELARIRDKNLLHVCRALVCDMFDESARQNRHELSCSSLFESDGSQFYWDPDGGYVQIPPSVPSFTPDYAGAVHALVTNRDLRESLSPCVLRTLEYVLRKLASGADAEDVLSIVAQDIRRDERTVRRHLAEANKAAVRSPIVRQILGGFLLPQDAIQSFVVHGDVCPNPQVVGSEFD